MAPEVPGVIARAIRARRMELGLSVEEAAERGRVHVTSWRLIETGTMQPSVLVMGAVCRVLDWTPATIESLTVGEMSVDRDGEVVVDLDRWPGQGHAVPDPVHGPAAAVAPLLDVTGLTIRQLAEVQDFIDELRSEMPDS
jgi:DNA-binding XRE family transcriptional regulator